MSYMKNKDIDRRNQSMEELVESIAKRLGLPKSRAKNILPKVGTEFVVEGIVYEVEYTRNNPLRITAKPKSVYIDSKTRGTIKLGLLKKRWKDKFYDVRFKILDRLGKI